MALFFCTQEGVQFFFKTCLINFRGEGFKANIDKEGGHEISLKKTPRVREDLSFPPIDKD